MNVRELVGALSKFDPELEVRLSDELPKWRNASQTWEQLQCALPILLKEGRVREEVGSVYENIPGGWNIVTKRFVLLG